LAAYEAARMDLSAVGGRKDGAVWDGVVQTVDIETGEVLFEWRSLDHVDLAGSRVTPPKALANRFPLWRRRGRGG
jgi:hypothetical protein